MADCAVNRVELRIDAAMCAAWAVEFAGLAAFATIKDAADRAAAAAARAQVRNRAGSVLCAACRRTLSSTGSPEQNNHRSFCFASVSTTSGCN